MIKSIGLVQLAKIYDRLGPVGHDLLQLQSLVKASHYLMELYRKALFYSMYLQDKTILTSKELMAKPTALEKLVLSSYK